MNIAVEIPAGEEARLEALFRQLIEQLGEDPRREGVLDTPARAARAFRFLTEGYRRDVEEEVNGALFTSRTDQVVVVKEIEFYSLCEHHLLPFLGQAHVGYQPDGQIIGLSKIARIVDIFARRLQVQERLTQQIAESIMQITRAKGVGVIMEAKHMCMMMRGVEKQNSVMRTSCMLGSFKDLPQIQAQLMNIVEL